MGGEGMLPVRWMAPESLSDATYTPASDIWSYAIVCWEIYSGGMIPYCNMTNVEVYGFLMDNGRLNQPGLMPDAIYQGVCMECWVIDVFRRPEHEDIHNTLSAASQGLTTSKRLDLTLEQSWPCTLTVQRDSAPAFATPRKTLPAAARGGECGEDGARPVTTGRSSPTLAYSPPPEDDDGAASPTAPRSASQSTLKLATGRERPALSEDAHPGVPRQLYENMPSVAEESSACSVPAAAVPAALSRSMYPASCDSDDGGEGDANASSSAPQEQAAILGDDLVVPVYSNVAAHIGSSVSTHEKDGPPSLGRR